MLSIRHVSVLDNCEYHAKTLCMATMFDCHGGLVVEWGDGFALEGVVYVSNAAGDVIATYDMRRPEAEMIRDAELYSAKNDSTKTARSIKALQYLCASVKEYGAATKDELELSGIL